MHQSSVQRNRVSHVLGLVLAITWLIFPAPAFGQSLGLTAQANPADPELAATVVLLISMMTVVAIKRKHPELSLLAIASTPVYRRPISRRRSRR